MTADIQIKGMVCERCVSVVKEGITKLGFQIASISLGKLTLTKKVDDERLMVIESFLNKSGFELISNKQTRIVKQAKAVIAEVFSREIKADAHMKFSSLLSEKLNMNYDSISSLFTQSEGITLEKYIITKRLEKVKELLVYTELTLTDIAYFTGFSSINHLSRQFKELTGLAPSHFKSIKASKKTLSGKSPEVL